MAVKTNAPESERVSFKLTNFSAGGILPDGIYLAKRHQFVLWDYDGKMQGNTLALEITFQTYDPKTNKESGEEQLQRYSVGNPEYFVPTPDGSGIARVGTRTQPANNSNFHVYVENLINAGYPEDKYDNDCTVFDGMVVQITHIPAPKRSNMPKSNLVARDPEQPERERTIPVVSSIVRYPWDAAKKGAAAAKPPAGKTSVAPKAAPKAEANGAGDDDDQALLVEHLSTVLENETSIPRTKARLAVFKSMQAAKVEAAARDAAIKIFNDEAQLASVLEVIGTHQVTAEGNIEAV